MSFVVRGLTVQPKLCARHISAQTKPDKAGSTWRRHRSAHRGGGCPPRRSIDQVGQVVLVDEERRGEQMCSGARVKRSSVVSMPRGREQLVAIPVGRER